MTQYSLHFKFWQKVKSCRSLINQLLISWWWICLQQKLSKATVWWSLVNCGCWSRVGNKKIRSEITPVATPPLSPPPFRHQFNFLSKVGERLLTSYYENCQSLGRWSYYSISLSEKSKTIPSLCWKSAVILVCFWYIGIVFVDSF